MVLLAKEVQCSFVPSIVRSANTTLSRTGGRSQNLNVQIYPIQWRIKWFCLSSRSNATSFVPSFAAAAAFCSANTTLNRTSGRSLNLEGPVEASIRGPPVAHSSKFLDLPPALLTQTETDWSSWALLRSNITQTIATLYEMRGCSSNLRASGTGGGGGFYWPFPIVKPSTSWALLRSNITQTIATLYEMRGWSFFSSFLLFYFFLRKLTSSLWTLVFGFADVSGCDIYGLFLTRGYSLKEVDLVNSMTARFI